MTLQVFIGWAQVFGSLVTAVATIALVYVTFVLTRETKRLADIGQRPHVVVSIESRARNGTVLDLVVSNTGTAIAYDIRIESRPEFPHLYKDQGVPLQQISLIKPAQELRTLLAYYDDFSREPYVICISWAKSPDSTTRETYEYQIDVTHLAGLALQHDDLHDISRHLEHIRDDWRRVASGSQRLSVNVYDTRDRLRERRDRDRSRRERQRQVRAADVEADPQDS